MPSHRNGQESVRSSISYNIYPCNAVAAVDTRREEKIWLIHQRLGHASFQTFRCVYLDEFKGFFIEDIVCDICEEQNIREIQTHMKI